MGLVAKIIDLLTGKKGVERQRRDRERDLDRERRRDR